LKNCYICLFLGVFSRQGLLFSHFPANFSSVLALAKGKPVINGLKRVKCAAVAAEPQFQFPAGFYQSGCPVHQFLDDGTNPPAFRRVPHWRAITEKAKLADEPQDVIGQAGQRHDQGICRKLSGRQPFKIHVGFKFTVKLLAGAVVLVEFDDLLFRQVK
jgi:hypothetical protein